MPPDMPPGPEDTPDPDETDIGWGEKPESDDDRLRAERPPHWDSP